MEYDYKQGRRLRRLADVPRWCVVPTIRKQDVAQHSFQVAVVARWFVLTQIRDEECRTLLYAQYLMALAIDHDELESVSGDIASPFKRVHAASVKEWEEANTPIRTPLTKMILKFADLIEAYVFLVEEKAMGNSRVEDIRLDIEAMVMKLWHANKALLTAESPPDLLMYARAAFNVAVHPGIESLESL